MSETPCISPVDVVVWLDREAILSPDGALSETTDLIAAGLDSMAVMQLVVAAEDEFQAVLRPEDLTRENLATPVTLAALLDLRRA